MTGSAATESTTRRRPTFDTPLGPLPEAEIPKTEQEGHDAMKRRNAFIRASEGTITFAERRRQAKMTAWVRRRARVSGVPRVVNRQRSGRAPHRHRSVTRRATRRTGGRTAGGGGPPPDPPDPPPRPCAVGGGLAGKHSPHAPLERPDRLLADPRFKRHERRARIGPSIRFGRCDHDADHDSDHRPSRFDREGA
jgi:hypothetical protein